MKSEKICELFDKIMEQEMKMYPESQPFWLVDIETGDDPDAARIYTAQDMLNLVWRTMDIARSAFVPRGYNSPYGLSDEKFFYESISAHTNLVTSIVTSALDFQWCSDFGDDRIYNNRTDDGYSYREIIKVVRLHDLAEIETGDIADNGNRDEALKLETEYDFVADHLHAYPEHQHEFTQNVLKLFCDMQEQVTPTGRLIYLADKISAVIITLALDYEFHSPMIRSDSSYLSERDHEEIAGCDHSYDGGLYRASEMWTIDYFKTRNLAKLDDTLFFTALVVMSTLYVEGRWYNWRERDYQDLTK